MSDRQSHDAGITYSWELKAINDVETVRLDGDGIAVETSTEKQFHRYESITEIYLVPSVSGGEPMAMLVFNQKRYGIRSTLTISGPAPGEPQAQSKADRFNHFVSALHRILMQRSLTPTIKFKCGVALNIWGWLVYGYPFIRATALILAPIGAVAGLVMQSFGFVLTCVGGGVAMLLAPKYAPPKVPKDLRRIRPYSPDAIPDGCLAYAMASANAG
jgi:hypothetical protein